MLRNIRFMALAVAAASCGGGEPSPGEDEAASAQAEVSAITSVAPSAAEVGVAAVSPAYANAQRFLEQATFGPRPVVIGQPVPTESVEHVLSVGIGAALVAQLDEPAGVFAPTPPRAAPCDGAFPAELDPGSQFFVDTLTGEDQLRLRTTFALSQILVVSTNGIPENRTTCSSEKRDAMVRYLNALRAGAFGSYRELLEQITLEPAMGTFLNMANNVGMGPSGAITANENFARELLQLFTLGTYKLNDRGERVLVGGVPQPAYNEGDVKAFARTLTGWTYPSPSGCPTNVGGKLPARYDGPMIPCQQNHNSAKATLLVYPGAPAAGVTTDGATARKHLEEALDNVFYHPNLPPFVSKQLIQHLVTSNPSPEYVARVVDKFKDDGSTLHRRGNLRVVIRTILLDPEARNPTVLASYGRLRAPAELLTRVLRALAVAVDSTGGKTPGTYLNQRSGLLGQSVPKPPSVFSYYPPDQPAPGSDLVGPEFGLLDTNTITQRAAFLHALLHTNVFTNAGIDVGAGLALVPGTPVELIDWIDQHLLHGKMSTGPAGLRTTLTEALADSRSGDANAKKRLALFLTILSPEFEIQR